MIKNEQMQGFQHMKIPLTHKNALGGKYLSSLQNIKLKMSSRRQNKTSKLTYPIIQNVVSFAKMDIEGELNLKYLAQKIEGSRFNKKRFPAVIMRKTKPRCTVLCFRSGRMIVIGSQSQYEAENAARRAIKDVSKVMGFKAEMVSFRITNMVANADIGFQIHIESLSTAKNVVRNDNFPGVVYKNLETIKSVLVFASGKVVFTGAKSKEDIDRAFIQLRQRLRAFQTIEKQNQE